jgi:hypothetical protein
MPLLTPLSCLAISSSSIGLNGSEVHAGYEVFGNLFFLVVEIPFLILIGMSWKASNVDHV